MGAAENIRRELDACFDQGRVTFDRLQGKGRNAHYVLVPSGDTRKEAG